MSIKPEYLKLFVNATEKAAYGAFKFVGKTSDYVSVYTGCYRIEAKKIQQKKARNGCLTYAAAYLLFVGLISTETLQP